MKHHATLMWITLVGLLFCSSAAFGRQAIQSPEDPLEQSISLLAKSIAEGPWLETVAAQTPVVFVNFREKTTNEENGLGEYIADCLRQDLCNIATGKFVVVERARLSTLLQEAKLTSSDLFDQSKRPAVGKLLPGSLIVLGTVADLEPGTLHLQVDVVKLETGAVLKSSRISLKETALSRTLREKKVAVKPQSGDETRRRGKNNQPVLYREVVNGLIVEVNAVERQHDGSVVVKLTLESSERDLDVAVGSNQAEMVNDLGSSYWSRRGTVGTIEMEAFYRLAPIVAGTPVSATVTFEGVESDAESISRLTVQGRAANHGSDRRSDWTIVARDLAIPRQKGGSPKKP